MGWFPGSSTRTPTTVSSFTCTPLDASNVCREPTPAPRAASNRRRSAAELRAQADPHEGGVQPHRQARELPGDLVRPAASLRVPLPDQGRDHLLDQSELALGAGADGPEMARLEAE